jgi:hypothetical protein
MKRFKLYSGLFLLFASGLVVGAVLAVLVIVNGVNKVLDGGPDASRASTVKRMAWQLNLNEEQKTSLNQIVRDFQVRTIGARRDSLQEMSTALDEAYGRFKPQLDQKQQQKLEELYEQMQRRLKLYSTMPSTEKDPD